MEGTLMLSEAELQRLANLEESDSCWERTMSLLKYLKHCRRRPNSVKPLYSKGHPFVRFDKALTEASPGFWLYSFTD